MPWDLRAFVSWILKEYEPAVRVGGAPGAYRASPDGRGVELYGVADMAGVLYSLRRLRPDEDGRRGWESAFAAFQDPLTGHFVEGGRPSHVELHVTAYAQAAMELLDLDPPAPLRFADGYRSPRAAASFVDTLDWTRWVYLESHRGAGLASIFANAATLRTPSWFRAYFDALETHLDPVTGMFGDRKPPEGDLDQVGGTFHYAFVYAWANRELAHAPNRIDRVLALQRDDGVWDPENPYWLTLDGVYLLARGARASGHRIAEVAAAAGRAVEAVCATVLDQEARDAAFGAPMGTHALAAVVCLLAEAQGLLGSEVIVTDQPLRSVLDRRPFI